MGKTGQPWSKWMRYRKGQETRKHVPNLGLSLALSSSRGFNNCVRADSLYAICCRSPCERLMNVLEEKATVTSMIVTHTRQELDHYSDPSGTESCNVQTSLDHQTCLQVHIHGQWMLPSLMHSFVGQSSIRELCPPALLLLLERERTEGRKREQFYIYSDVTHTHTRPEPGQPWKARGRKKRKQTTGKRPKQRRGGRGTDGPPKPTYTAKRTWPKQCTHLNPTTHYGEARGELGTKWGTSWWQTRKTKTISLKIRTQSLNT